MTLLERLRTAPPPPTLFHYTQANGLLGILETNTLWATTALYLNDSSEYLHGRRVIHEALVERIQKTEDPAERSGLQLIDLTFGTEFYGVCIVSLTAKGDQLSQWRAYAGHSGGFAIGFQSDSLRRMAEPQGFYLAECIYNDDAQREAVNGLLNEFSCQIAEGKKWSWSEAGACAAAATRLSVMLKHESFQEEHEWRLLSIPRPVSALKFRPGASMLLPYSEFDLGPDRNAYLKSVVIGPTPHTALSRESVQMLLEKLELNDAKGKAIDTSIPYRNW